MKRKLILIFIAVAVAAVWGMASPAVAQDEKSDEAENEDTASPASEENKAEEGDAVLVEMPEIPREFASVKEYMKNLDEQRRSIEREKQALIALRTEVRADIERLLKLQKDIDSRLKVEDEQRADKIKKLVKIYSKMKPAQVVPLLNNLDENLRLQVIYQMNTKDQASILALMPAEKAAAITQKIMKKDFK